MRLKGFTLDILKITAAPSEGYGISVLVFGVAMKKFMTFLYYRSLFIFRVREVEGEIRFNLGIFFMLWHWRFRYKPRPNNCIDCGTYIEMPGHNGRCAYCRYIHKENFQTCD